jgi:hypothetical protein
MIFTDTQLIEAIKASLPYQYNRELYERVRAYLGNPDVSDEPCKYGFDYRVYSLTKDYERQAEKERIEAMGFSIATHDVMASLENKTAEVLRGVGSIFGGERIESGKVKADGRGSFLFLPGKNRTKGILPHYIRKAA